MKNYLLRHLQVLVSTFGQLSRTPITTLLSLLVIGITLALPTGLYVLATNLEAATAGWDRGGQISLYLHRKVSDADQRKLAERVRNEDGVALVEVITRDQALAEFKRYSGFGPALQALTTNPLPAVLVVHPVTTLAPATVELLRSRLARLPGVEEAELDLAWLQRLHALLDLAERAAGLLAVLFSTAVLLIIGNITRFNVINRQAEIEIMLLVGGTLAFVRRPFLYMGAVQGLLGAALALLLVEVSLWALDERVQQLARLYASRFQLIGLDAAAALTLLGLGALLGGLGARLAVALQLRRILVF